MTTLAVLQPGYLPWLGFFDQMDHADVFVYYDDVQYDKHGWRNRNRIKSGHGPQWLTVPVLHSGLSQPRIMDVEIDHTQKWAKKHLASIQQFYAKAPHINDYIEELADILMRPWTLLVDLDLALIDFMGKGIGLQKRCIRSSTLGISGERSERLLKICQHFGAKKYLSGAAAQDYLEVELFSRQDIQVLWQDYRHPIYPQLHGPFIPHLSTLDLMLNVGYESLKVIRGGHRIQS